MYLLIIHYFLLLFIFFLDILLQGFYACPSFYLTRILYYISLFKNRSIFEYSFIAGLVMLQSFLYNESFGADLIVIIPLTLMALYLRSIVSLNNYVIALFAIIGGFIHFSVIDFGLLHRPLSCIVTVKSIFFEYLASWLILTLLYSKTPKKV